MSFFSSETIKTILDPAPRTGESVEKKVKPKQVDYLEIRVYSSEYWAWNDMLVNGKPLPPEVAGLLLGRARPVYKEEEI